MVGITILVVWYNTREPEITAEQQNELLTSGPDYYMENFSYKVMNEDGRLNYNLHAEHMDHYIDNATTLLKMPNIVFYQQPERLWNLTAQTGRITNIDQLIVLEGEVHIQRMDIKAETDIRTANLTILPQQKRIHTNASVTITSPAGSVEAVGLEADFLKDQVLLKSKVRTLYLPPDART